MKLLIRNLARTTTESELQAMFEAYGKVQSCTLVRDKETGKSKGFGFVEMPRPGDARAARKNLNGIDVAGSIIRVKNAESSKPGRKESEVKQAEAKLAITKKDIPDPWDRRKKSKAAGQDPLHGITLKMVVTELVEKYGWEELGRRIEIKCFTNDPSISSTLKFLRKTPWARKKVETLYLHSR